MLAIHSLGHFLSWKDKEEGDLQESKTGHEVRRTEKAQTVNDLKSKCHEQSQSNSYEWPWSSPPIALAQCTRHYVQHRVSPGLRDLRERRVELPVRMTWAGHVRCDLEEIFCLNVWINCLS